MSLAVTPLDAMLTAPPELGKTASLSTPVLGHFTAVLPLNQLLVVFLSHVPAPPAPEAPQVNDAARAAVKCVIITASRMRCRQRRLIREESIRALVFIQSGFDLVAFHHGASTLRFEIESCKTHAIIL